MPGLVLDTHALLWLILRPTRLSDTARAAIRNAVEAGESLNVSVLTLVEVTYLIDKGKLASGAWDQIRSAITDPGTRFRLVPLDESIADALRRVPFHEIPEMPDRIIAATALRLGLSIVTRDLRIRASSVRSIW